MAGAPIVASSEELKRKGVFQVRVMFVRLKILK